MNGEEHIPVAVGTAISGRPPHRSVRAELPHTALTLDIWLQTAALDRDEERVGVEGSRKGKNSLALSSDPHRVFQHAPVSQIHPGPKDIG